MKFVALSAYIHPHDHEWLERKGGSRAKSRQLRYDLALLRRLYDMAESNKKLKEIIDRAEKL